MSNESNLEVLVTKRLDIVKNLNCERTLLLDHLRANHVFDQEDCELILAEKTTAGKAGKLVDFLVKKGPKAYQHFLDVVQVENAALFETLTGMRSTSKPSVLMRQLTGPEHKSEGVNSFEIRLLAEHQQRMYRELQDISLKYSQLLRVKEDLEEKLIKTDQDLKFEKERRQEYESRLSKEREEDENLQKHGELLVHECDEMEKGIADRDVYIIVLQMKLLAEKEESEKLRAKVFDLEQTHENVARQLRRVSENYKNERCQSLKLSECIRLQVDEIQKIEDLKKRLRESQYQNILMREERDCITQELKELKKWAEALKTRFDVVEKEKFHSLEKNEYVTNNCANLQESVRALQRKQSLLELEIEELRKRNDLVSKDSEIYKKQRDNALDARKEAILDRDKALSDKEAVQTQYNELQAKRDKISEDRLALIKDYDALEIRYKTSLEELTLAKRELNESMLEVEDLSRRLKEAEEKSRRSSRLMDMSRSEACDRCNKKAAAEMTDELSDDDDGGDDDNVQAKYPWRERRLKSLLDSMKHRIAGDRLEGDISKDPVSPVCGNMTLEVLHYLLPNITSRPYCSTVSSLGTPASRSLQRRPGFKREKNIEERYKASTLPASMSGFGQGERDKPKDNNNTDNTNNPSCQMNAASDSKDSRVTKDTRDTKDTKDISSDADVNRLPASFRDRSGDMTVKLRRDRSSSDEN